MNSGNVICILAKYPRPGKVKASLDSVLGTKQAALLSRALIMDTISTSLKVPRADTAIAYWPAESRKDFEDLVDHFQREEPNEKTSLRASEIALIPQAGRNQGERLKVLSQGFFECGARRLVFTCSDNPLLDSSIIRASFELLRKNKAVVGPTFDGGFYLFGVGGHYPGLYDEINWETKNIYRQLSEKLDADCECWQELEISYDVDRPEELDQLYSDIDNLRLTGRDDICCHTERCLLSLKR